MQYRIGFIGTGNMASSILLGLLKKGWPAQSIRVSSPKAETKDWLQQQSISVAANNQQLVNDSDIIILATKPNQIATALHEVQLNPEQCLISIAAGISTEFLEKLVSSNRGLNIIRAMPNTPSLIGKGICGLYANTTTRKLFGEIAETIFSAVGTSVWVDDESLMDTVTAISGSGPAYYFLMVESIIEAACEQGLDRKIATMLAYETISGSAALLKSSELSPDLLRQQVTSPGGTTAAAIESFGQSGFKATVKNAIGAATERGKSLLKKELKNS